MFIFLISTIVIIIDQIIKLLVESNLIEDIIIIKNFFNITYIRNYGAAFSILNGNTLFLIIVSIISLFLIYFFLIKNKKLKIIEKVIYGFLIGGLLGNLFDRIIRGYVIDYLAVKIVNYNFPIFNFADICIVLSTILLLIILGCEEYGGKWRKENW